MRAVLTRSKSNDIGLVGRAIHGITLPLVAVHIKGKNTTNANRIPDPSVILSVFNPVPEK